MLKLNHILNTTIRRKYLISQHKGIFTSNNGVEVTPSSKTNVIIPKLPLAVTESSLKTAISSIGIDDIIRRIDLQPGCLVHLQNQIVAEKLSKIFIEKYSSQVIM